MPLEKLEKALKPVDGQLTLTAASLDEGFRDLLKTCYAGQPLVISGAKATTEGGTILVSGRASVLNAADRPVEARFSIDETSGAVSAVLKYQLREVASAANAWSFSQSFPELPATVNYAGIPATANEDRSWLTAQRPFLDSLPLYDTYCVAATAAGIDPDLKAPLEPGLNIVSRMRLEGALGVLEHSVKKNAKDLLVYGTVRLPQPAEVTPELEPLERVWTRTTAPGIHLRADMGLNLGWKGMSLKDVCFRVYSPLTRDWLESNPSFQPKHGYSAVMAMPGAGIEVDLGAELGWGVPEAEVYGECSGVSVGKLEQLAEVAGAPALDGHLPAPLRSVVNELEKIELTHVGMILEAGRPLPTVRGLALTVGLPRLNWKLFDGALEVENIFCRFDASEPFGDEAGSMIASVYGTLDVGGVPLFLMGTGADGGTLFASLEESQTLPLAKFMERHLPNVPAPSDLTIDRMTLRVTPGKSYGFSVGMAEEPGWTIPVGHSSLTIKDLYLAVDYRAELGTSSRFSGTIDFPGGFTLSVGYDVPGNLTIRGLFDEISLLQLADALTNRPFKIVKDFDLALEQVSVLIEKRADGRFVFQAAAQLDGVGPFAFEAREIDGSWGFAGGMALLAGSPSDLPGMSALKRFEEAFHLRELIVTLSSFDDPAFRFPDVQRFNNPYVSGGVSLPGSGGIGAGLSVSGQWTLDTQDKKHKLLRKLLGLDPSLAVTIQVGENPELNTKLFVRYDATIQGHPLTCEFGGMVQDGELGLFLIGEMTFKIQGAEQTFDLVMVFVENGAFLSADMKGGTAIDFHSFKLADLALEIGVSWEGLPSLGIAATIDAANFESSIAMFFDAENPAKSLLAGAVSNLTLHDLMSLAGPVGSSPVDDVLKQIGVHGTHQFDLPASLADSLDRLDVAAVSQAFRTGGGVTLPSTSDQVHLIVTERGRLWHLTDMTNLRHYQVKSAGGKLVGSVEAQFYCAPEPTRIGTIPFPAGFYVNAGLKILGFDSEATVTINANKGIAVDAGMSKIVFVSEVLFCIKADTGAGGPRISMSTFNQPDHAVPSCRPPHFKINGFMEIMGAAQGVELDVTAKGVEFDLKGGIIPGVILDMNGFFGPQRLELGGGAKVGLGTIDLGPIGKIRLNTDAAAAIDVQVSGGSVKAAAEAEFEAAGHKHRIASFTLDVSDKALAKLPDTLVKKAQAVLQQFFQQALKDVEQAEKKVKELNAQIDDLRRSIQQQRDKDLQKYKAAQAQLTAAQSKVGSIDRDIKSTNAQINDLKDKIEDKKRWSKKGNIFEKAGRAAVFAAYSAEKGAEIAGLYTKIGGLEAAEKTADAALEVAKQSVKGLASVTNLLPIDADPRIVALLAARDTATAALETAKLPLKALA